MSITPTPKGTGRVPSAACVCDVCLHHEDQAADYERGGNGNWKLNEGQVRARLSARGWSFIKGVLRCPTCEQKRKGENTVTKAAAAPYTPGERQAVAVLPTPDPGLRQPTRDQKRAIHDMLTSVYDVKAGRYTGTDTDKSVAAVLGDGILFGWVAQIREEFFGPNGNEELALLGAALDALNARVDATLAEADRRRSDFKELIDTLVTLQSDARDMTLRVRKLSGPSVAKAV